MGVSLFTRDRRGTRPTTAGVEFQRYVQRILQNCDRAGQEIDTLRTGGVGRVTIGAGASYIADVVSHAVARAAEEMPALEIEVSEGLIEDLLSPLMDGRTDLIVTTFAGFTMHADLALEPLVTVTPGIMVGAKHTLARKRDVRAADLVVHEWASVCQPFTVDVLQRFFHSNRVVQPTPVVVESLDVIRALLLSGRFMALLPDRAVALELAAGDVVRLPFDVPSTTLRGGILYLQKRVRSAAVERVLQLLREACTRERP
jgi:DNA-binding transcriptional LysR family regulator